jgi:hypothetical protein
MEFLLVATIVGVVIAGICAMLGYAVGTQRGQGPLGMVLGLFLGPIGILVASLLPEAEQPIYGHPKRHRRYVPGQSVQEEETDEWIGKL